MTLQPKASHFINGVVAEETEGTPFDVVHHATGEVIARMHAATNRLISEAVASAKAAQVKRAALRPVERGRLPNIQGMDGGLSVESKIFTWVTDKMRLACEKIFDPVMSIQIFDTEEEVIAHANDSKIGLAAAVFTQNIQRRNQVAGRLQARTCRIKTYNTAPVEVPFGGVKTSDLGRECSMAALEHYSQFKSVFVDQGAVVSLFRTRPGALGRQTKGPMSPQMKPRR